MVVVDGQGIPLGSTLASASPSEFKLAEETLETVKVPRAGRGRPKKRPMRLIADPEKTLRKLSSVNSKLVSTLSATPDDTGFDVRGLTGFAM